MVEVTLTLVKDVLTIVGVIAGFSYYVMTVRNANKARQIQLSLHLSETMRDIETNKIGIELLKMEWKDFDDFVSRYDSTVNADSFTKRWKMWNTMESVGYMLHKGFLEIDSVYNIMGSYALLQ